MREAERFLERAFFESDPVTCARGLIGRELVWGPCAGVIVETEAYAAEGDPACHTFSRKGAREFVARHRAGDAYIYFNYGMYWLLNVLVKGGAEGFVLIRALEPTRGLAMMRQRRGRERAEDLCSGPGKICAAFGLDGRHHGRPLCGLRSRGIRAGLARAGGIKAGPRVGISRARDLLWRFSLEGSPFVSAAK